jgi:hypothetical protein
MAAVGHSQYPLIVESIPSPRDSSRACLPTPSPDPCSTSNSSTSSRPQSLCSNTSRSNLSPSPSENLKDCPLQDPTDHASTTSPTVNPLPPPSTLSPTSQPSSADNQPESVPPNASTDPHTLSTNTSSRQNSLFRSLWTRIHGRRWLGNTIGALGLATAIWLGVRGYKLAVWSSWNDLRQLCSSYQQVRALSCELNIESSPGYRTRKS